MYGRRSVYFTVQYVQNLTEINVNLFKVSSLEKINFTHSSSADSSTHIKQIFYVSFSVLDLSPLYRGHHPALRISRHHPDPADPGPEGRHPPGQISGSCPL